MINYAEEYYDHYQEYLGRAIDREIFECNKDLPQIQILKYEKVFKDCIVYSTIGLTKYNEVLNNVLEVTMVSDSAFDDISSILANVLFFCIQNDIQIINGATISGIENINKEFSNKYDKCAICFTEPYAFPEEYMDVYDIEDNKIGEVLLAFLISQKEYDYIIKYGYDRFEDLLERNNVDLFNIARESVI